MNWLAMGPGLVDGADAPRNGWLTLLLVLLLPGASHAFDGSISLELAGGNRVLSASLIGDWGLVPEKLYLVTTYGVVRQQPDEQYSSTPSHLVGLGIDWLPTRHLLTSLSGSFSPKATDVTTLSDNLIVRTTRRSAQGFLAFAYQSAGLSRVEWGFDGGLMTAWYELDARVRAGPLTFERVTPLVLVRPSLGFTLTFDDRTDVGLRGSYTYYSGDPTSVGFELPQRFATSLAAQAVQVAVNLTAGFSSAPVWFDARVSVLHRFTPRFSTRFAYTLMRYVNGIGTAHVLGSRFTVKVAGWARLWAGLSVQYDWLSTPPSFWSGYATLGAELSTE